MTEEVAGGHERVSCWRMSGLWHAGGRVVSPRPLDGNNRRDLVHPRFHLLRGGSAEWLQTCMWVRLPGVVLQLRPLPDGQLCAAYWTPLGCPLSSEMCLPLGLLSREKEAADVVTRAGLGTCELSGRYCHTPQSQTTGRTALGWEGTGESGELGSSPHPPFCNRATAK